MADIKNDVIMSEAEKQEKAIRDEYNAKKRKKRIKKLITWLIVILLIVSNICLVEVLHSTDSSNEF